MTCTLMPPTPLTKKEKLFGRVVRRYYRKHGRNLPWRLPALKLQKSRGELDPYKILVSEIMLQQTQVARVQVYYPKFIRQFPDFRSLARSSLREVLRAWQGLGYNRRALSLKRITEIVVRDYRGKLPREAETLRAFPGIGKATAASVVAFAFNTPVPFIETNIRRAYIHFFFPAKHAVHDAEILPLVEKTLDHANPREWYWALMDYGAMLGVNLKKNPNRKSVHYQRQPRFRGSSRELRGKITKFLTQRGRCRTAELQKVLERSRNDIESTLRALTKEGFVTRRRNLFLLQK